MFKPFQDGKMFDNAYLIDKNPTYYLDRNTKNPEGMDDFIKQHRDLYVYRLNQHYSLDYYTDQYHD